MRIVCCCCVLVLALLAVPLQAAPRTMTVDDFIATLETAPATTTDQPTHVDLSTDRRGTASRATCIASCGGGTTVSCSYTPPSTCTAVDRNCPSSQGYVTCNGVTTFCQPSCNPPPTCTEGQIRNIWTGACCDNNTKEKEQQRCTSGTWVPTGIYSCSGPCGPIIP